MTRLILTTALVTSAHAATYTVQNLNSSGYRSLRWAIQKANTHAGSDRIVFDSGLLGGVIKPTTPLDILTDAGTTIDGDINNDGKPDITLDGSLQATFEVLRIGGNDCVMASATGRDARLPGGTGPSDSDLKGEG